MRCPSPNAVLAQERMQTPKPKPQRAANASDDCERIAAIDKRMVELLDQRRTIRYNA
jgi:hypothetical protein